MKQKQFKESNFKATLYKNSKTPIIDIPNDFIEEVYLKWNDTSEMSLKIPSLVMRNGKTIDNPLFNKIGFLRQEIVTQNPDIRFLISEIPEITEECYQGANGKLIKYKVKQIKCKSYEGLCLGKLVLSETISRQLYNDGTSLDVSEGLLDGFFLKDNPYWTIGYCSEKAKKEIGTSEKKNYEELYNNKTFQDLQLDTVLWEKDFSELPLSPFDENSCINIKISYKNTVTTNSITNIEMEKTDYTHNISDIYTDITHIKATYMKQDDGTYSICYELTLSDGNVIKKYNQFIYSVNINLNIGKAIFEYSNGEKQTDGNIKYRAFETGEYEWIDFLRNTVSEAYDGLYFEFDTVNKVLNVYSKEEYGENKGINFSYENYVKSISRKVVSDNIISDLLVTSNNTSIASVNPYGNEHIYDYTYFINNDLMSDELLAAWNSYSELIDGKIEQKTQYLDEINELDRKFIKLESERTAIDENTKWLKIRRVDYQAQKGFDTEIQTLSTQINSNMDKFNSLTLQIENIKKQIADLKANAISIVNLLNKETAKDSNGNLIFDKDLLEELRKITISKTVQDETYLTPQSLYNHYKEELYKNNTNYLEFTVDVEGFLQGLVVPNNVEWTYYAKLGDYANLTESDDLTENEKGVRIIEYKLYPKENRLVDIVFSSRDKEKSATFSNVSGTLSTVSKLNNYNFSFKDIWNESKNVNDFVKNIESGIDTSLVAIRNKSGRCLKEDTEAGTYYIDGNEENNQLYIGASMICFTQDKWLTSNSALTPEGLNASVIYGELLVGKQLHIVSDNYGTCSFYVGNIKDTLPDDTGTDFGIQIRDNMDSSGGQGRERIFLGIENNEAKLRLVNGTINTKTKAIEDNIVLSESGYQIMDNSSMPDNLDNENPFEMPYRVGEEVTEIRKAILSIYAQKFRAYEKGAKASSQIQTTSGASSTQSSGMTGDATSVVGYVTSIPSVAVAEYDTHTHVVNVGKLTEHSHDISHTHSIEIEGHTHDIIYGIYKSTLPTNMNVYVNDTLVMSGLNGEFNEIDITNYLELGKENKIKITSNTLGRIVANVWAKMFATW